jgi:hypothetical protein
MPAFLAKLFLGILRVCISESREVGFIAGTVATVWIWKLNVLCLISSEIVKYSQTNAVRALFGCLNLTHSYASQPRPLPFSLSVSLSLSVCASMHVCFPVCVFVLYVCTCVCRCSCFVWLWWMQRRSQKAKRSEANAHTKVVFLLFFKWSVCERVVRVATRSSIQWLPIPKLTGNFNGAVCKTTTRESQYVFKRNSANSAPVYPLCHTLQQPSVTAQ